MLKIILFISGGVFPIFSLSLLPTLLNTVVETKGNQEVRRAKTNSGAV